MAEESVIISPVSSESSIALREQANTLEFLVSRKATKGKVKREVEKRFNVKVEKVNVQNTLRGKRAFVKLASEYKASELATTLGML
ncbi:MAG: 50S ribosomal protein L23 [Thermoprotei archaeon]|nr:50S ribosomal protein L23 [TACK group archaeon]